MIANSYISLVGTGIVQFFPLLPFPPAVRAMVFIAPPTASGWMWIERVPVSRLKRPRARVEKRQAR